MLFIKERVSEAPALAKAHTESFGAKLRVALKNDASFRRLLLVRLLTSIENMASAFYIVFATERLGLGDESIGVFSIALLVGGLIGIAAFGWLASRFGPRRVINAAASCSLSPLLWPCSSRCWCLTNGCPRLWPMARLCWSWRSTARSIVPRKWASSAMPKTAPPR